jgi:DNA-binding IclR family transcriptional regulator
MAETLVVLDKIAYSAIRDAYEIGVSMKEVKTLAKGLQILDYLLTTSIQTDAQPTISVSEAASLLGVDKSNASRMLQTLSHYGYTQRTEGSRAYGLGGKLKNWEAASSQLLLRQLARPFLLQLMKRTGECAHIAIPLAAQELALIIDDVESTASLRVAGGMGRTEQLHCTAVGKCLLAFAGLPTPPCLEPRTAKTITEAGLLVEQLNTIRQQGYAYDDEENYDGVRCLAAPVYDQRYRVIACMGISGPTVRMSDARLGQLIQQVKDAATELSQSLGCSQEQRQSCTNWEVA